MNQAEEKSILDLFSRYQGKIEQENNMIKLKRINDLVHRGKIKCVPCLVSIVDHGDMEYRWSVRAEEKTCEILGGSSIGFETLEEALQNAKRKLEHYRFPFQEAEQTTLF